VFFQSATSTGSIPDCFHHVRSSRERRIIRTAEENKRAMLFHLTDKLVWIAGHHGMVGHFGQIEEDSPLISRGQRAQGPLALRLLKASASDRIVRFATVPSAAKLRRTFGLPILS